MNEFTMSLSKCTQRLFATIVTKGPRYYSKSTTQYILNLNKKAVELIMMHTPSSPSAHNATEVIIVA